MQMFHTVVLKLEEDKYWVARTRNPSQYIAYLTEEGNTAPAWVNKWGFIEVVDITSDDSRDVLVNMARQYGIKNVRGNAFPKVEPSEYQLLRFQALVDGNTEPDKPKRRRNRKQTVC
jgi:hypothetical protein